VLEVFYLLSLNWKYQVDGGIVVLLLAIASGFYSPIFCPKKTL